MRRNDGWPFVRWRAMQQKPLDGALFRRERLAPQMQLRFNLKKMA
jgi:hypothetical protein